MFLDRARPSSKADELALELYITDRADKPDLLEDLRVGARILHLPLWCTGEGIRTGILRPEWAVLKNVEHVMLHSGTVSTNSSKPLIIRDPAIDPECVPNMSRLSIMFYPNPSDALIIFPCTVIDSIRRYYTTKRVHVFNMTHPRCRVTDSWIAMRLGLVLELPGVTHVSFFETETAAFSQFARMSHLPDLQDLHLNGQKAHIEHKNGRTHVAFPD